VRAVGILPGAACMSDAAKGDDDCPLGMQTRPVSTNRKIVLLGLPYEALRHEGVTCIHSDWPAAELPA
jgi:hypothetical protein